MATENPFVKLFAIDFKDHLEVKKSGNTELKYVSWAYAWAEVKKLYPSASYEVKKFNGLPYVYDPITGFMVYTSVTIEGVSHEMWLPVLDGANKAMKATPYTYTTPKWDYNPQTRRREKVGMEERTVEAASMFDVNKAIMRCLVKNLAMFGLGLYVYAERICRKMLHRSRRQNRKSSRNRDPLARSRNSRLCPASVPGATSPSRGSS